MMNTKIFSQIYNPAKSNELRLDNNDIVFRRYSTFLFGDKAFNLDSIEENFLKILEEKNKALQPLDYLDDIQSKTIIEDIFEISSAFNSSAPISKSDTIISS